MPVPAAVQKSAQIKQSMWQELNLSMTSQKTLNQEVKQSGSTCLPVYSTSLIPSPDLSSLAAIHAGALQGPPDLHYPPISAIEIQV